MRGKEFEVKNLLEKGKTEQQKNLKSICMNELNSHPDIKDAIKTESQLEFFIIQMALIQLKMKKLKKCLKNILIN